MPGAIIFTSSFKIRCAWYNQVIRQQMTTKQLHGAKKKKHERVGHTVREESNKRITKLRFYKLEVQYVIRASFVLVAEN